MKKARTLFALFTGASAAAMMATPALAQETRPASGSDEIIVTSTGRQQTLQNVPVAVTALSAEAVKNAGITDIRTLTQVAASYKVATGQSNSAGSTIFIRGIGTGADNPGYESAVGVFIDGVYRSRPGVALSELPEVERIEVLRGPQGTLFGRNTSAGAVSIITAAPEFDQRVYGKLEAGNYGFLSSTLGFTGPISDTVAVRLEGNIQGRDGTIEDANGGGDVNDRNRYFVRGQALFDNQDNFSVRVILDHSETDEVCCTAIYNKTGSFTPLINALAAFRGVQGILQPTNEESFAGAFTPGRSYGEKVDDTGGSVEANLELTNVKLTSITSYRDWQTTRNQDIDFNGSDRAYRDGYNLNIKTFTQEFRAQGEAGRLNWLVGAFYANEKNDLKDTVRFGADGARYADILAAANQTALGLPGCGGFVTGNFSSCLTLYSSLPGQTAATPTLFGTALTPTAGALLGGAFGNAIRATAPVSGDGQQNELARTETESIALFTHNQIELTDSLEWTIGLRYNYETKDLSADLNANAAGCAVLQNTAPITGAPPGVTFNALANALAATPLGVFQLFACNPVVNTVANGKYTNSTEEKEWSGTTSLRWAATDDLNIYASYSRGYKAGGFNMDRSAFDITPTTTVRPSTNDWRFNPEFTDAYELGWKWSLPGRTTLNGTAYWQNITDYQINAFTGFNFRSFNASKVISRGAELEVVTRPNSILTLQSGLLFNEAFYDGRQVIPKVAEVIQDGTPLAGASKWTGTAAATFRGPIAGTSLAWLAYIDGRYQTKYRTQTLGRDPTGSTDQKGYGVINARLGIGAEDGTWSVEAWGRNLADQFYKVGAFGVPEQTGNFAIYPGEPRMYGVTLRANF